MRELILRIETKKQITIRDVTAFLSSVAALRDGIAYTTLPSAQDDDLFMSRRRQVHDERLPEGFQPNEWTRLLADVGRTLQGVNRSPDQGKNRSPDQDLVTRARAFTAMMDATLPRRPEGDLRIIGLRIGSLETVIEELVDEIAERLGRILRSAAALVPNRERVQYYKTLTEFAPPHRFGPRNRERDLIGQGMLGLASLSLEETLRSVEATDLETKEQ